MTNTQQSLPFSPLTHAECNVRMADALRLAGHELVTGVRMGRFTAASARRAGEVELWLDAAAARLGPAARDPYNA
jgi:hypothetical protein